MRQPHQPPLPNTTLQSCLAPKTDPLVEVYDYYPAAARSRSFWTTRSLVHRPRRLLEVGG
jgi:hypothetical protein